MARAKTCVHDRVCPDTAPHKHKRGPIIMPKGSWCFMCDGDGKNGSWKPARKLNASEFDLLHEEYYRPSFALPRSGWFGTWPMSKEAYDDIMETIPEGVTFSRRWKVADWADEYKLRNHNSERDQIGTMSFKRAVYTVFRNTREVELKFEPPITHGAQLNTSVFPPRFMPARQPKNLYLSLELPADQDRILIVVDEQEMKEYEQFKKLKEVTAQYKKVKAEAEDHDERESRHHRAALRAYEELNRIRRQQESLALSAGVK